ncbi:glycosyltransferase [Hymenobacter aerophilus]|uniref:glycosyltransferase n=1 Tax=Hymenobacter aerophilus TaxID=119644 RepID=UPI00039F1A89|nr:glycosyltransferase [Hymenobacter aerophilus]
MSTASSRVLLLGWNEALQPPEAPAPLLRALVQRLAPLTKLAVLLPHEPRPAFAAPATDAVRITGLAELELAAILTAAIPSPSPAAWQAPAAPYVGSSPAAVPGWQAPAAPYQGATPLATPNGSSASPTDSAGPLSEPTQPLPAAAEPPRAKTPDEGDFPPVGRDSGRASLAGPAAPPAAFPTLAPTTGQPENPRASLPEPVADTLSTAKATAAEPAIGPAAGPPLSLVHATLAQELAALGRNPPEASAADLNFQVIQYARFASSWACGKKFAVIYAVDWPTWLAAMEIRQLTGWPLVLHVHNLAQERAAPTETGWAVALERLALRRADLVLADSTEVAALLTERYQLPPERLRTVSSTNSAAINELLLHIEHHRPGRPAVAPITPPSS